MKKILISILLVILMTATGMAMDPQIKPYPKKFHTKDLEVRGMQQNVITQQHGLELVKTVTDTASGMNEFEIDGRTLYAIGYGSTDNFEIWDLSDIENPTKTYALSNANMQNAHALVITYYKGNKYAIVGNVNDTAPYLTVLKINPDNKSATIVQQVSSATYFKYLHSMAVSGGILWIHHTDGTNGRVSAWQISDIIENLSTAAPIGQVAATANLTSQEGGGMLIDGNQMYVVSYYTGTLYYIDISDKTSPTISQSYTDTANLKCGDKIAKRGKYLFCGNYQSNDKGGITVIDTTKTLGASAIVATLKTASLVWLNNIELAGNYIFGAHEDQTSSGIGLSVTDITDPTDPKFVWNVSYTNLDANLTRDVEITGQYLIQMGYQKLFVYKIPGAMMPAISAGSINIDNVNVNEQATARNVMVQDDAVIGSNASIGDRLTVADKFVMDGLTGKLAVGIDSNNFQWNFNKPGTDDWAYMQITTSANGTSSTDGMFFGLDSATMAGIWGGSGVGLSFYTDNNSTPRIQMLPNTPIKVNDQLRLVPQTTTLSTTALALTNNNVNLTCSGNALTTITGAKSGTNITIKFADACTVTDDETTTADTINIDGRNLFSAGDTLNLYYDGTKWYGANQKNVSPGSVCIDTTAVDMTGASSGVYKDLISCTVPANTLNYDGKALRFEAFGTVVGDDSTGRWIKCFAGDTSFRAVGSASFSSSADRWSVQGTIIRTGASAQKAHALMHASGNNVNYKNWTDYITPTNDTTADFTVKCQGASGEATPTATSIVQEGLLIYEIQ